MAMRPTSTSKGRRSKTVTLTRPSEQSIFGSRRASLALETWAPCHRFFGRSLNIPRVLGTDYAPIRGSL